MTCETSFCCESPRARRLPLGLVWLRRDLRLHDHAALSAALRACDRVALAFVFDRDILDALLQRGLQADRRVEFILAAVEEIDAILRERGAALIVRHASAREAIPALAAALGAQAVFCGRDDEPQARERDAAVERALQRDGRALHTVKEHTIFERDEVLTAQGKPYSVFTPYRTAWLARYAAQPQHPWEGELSAGRLASLPAALRHALPTLAELGFAPTNLRELKLPLGASGARELVGDFLRRIDDYDQARDFPARKGPSYLSVHLRFGTVSVRELAAMAWARQQAGSEGARVWLSELVWRDFYFQILFHHPQVVHGAFKPVYDRIQWRNDPAQFAAWCEGRTGYPLVDAAMRQIKQTGYMHNRLRMVVASFLTKDLGIDWRWGERYFADHLNDFDLAANNGGWQWAASSGCDAQPYFRIFNPVAQSEKFDARGDFIRRYLPELAQLSSKDIHAPWKAPTALLQAAGVRLGENYPAPIVRHDLARAETLERYSVMKAQ
ncbi:MAG: deoxyribodipyrimidine photo-lyase [Thiomonas sp.]|uniref:cryptochrome/photolyase family protein n=1 Tax=Thiomonas sp. TaxID=2047785 RepID=UPI002A364A2E|nr:deoxyribodipyrimidine photo-lyase [Thiomonas sp.]MDY0330845.1 deoxyribodipyrimidine photo-lyase [Thiomonas sp.]